MTNPKFTVVDGVVTSVILTSSSPFIETEELVSLLKDATVEQDKIDAERYRKLRRWMSSNVKEGWQEVERLGAIACYVDWDAFDAYLDELPVCNVGLCHVRQE